MQWRKVWLFNVNKIPVSWVSSHCQVPTVLVTGDHSIRVFFASRGENQYSHILFVDLMLGGDGQWTLTSISEAPVLSPGPTGFFDEHGVFPSSIVVHNGIYYMYYIGWAQGNIAPLFYASIGLALSRDGVNFERHSIAPLLSRSEHDPCLVTAPHVYLDNEKWRMTYVSGVKWGQKTNGELQSYYHIKTAISDDPYSWKRDGHVAIDFAGEEETNIARSSVLKLAERDYRMWYSFVHSDIGKYRIGYAESEDGESWIRRDQLAGIGLDSEYATNSICYPNVFEIRGEFYMLYNGNSFGKDGFGIAKCVDMRAGLNIR